MVYFLTSRMLNRPARKTKTVLQYMTWGVEMAVSTTSALTEKTYYLIPMLHASMKKSLLVIR